MRDYNTRISNRVMKGSISSGRVHIGAFLSTPQFSHFLLVDELIDFELESVARVKKFYVEGFTKFPEFFDEISDL